MSGTRPRGRRRGLNRIGRSRAEGRWVGYGKQRCDDIMGYTYPLKFMQRTVCGNLVSKYLRDGSIDLSGGVWGRNRCEPPAKGRTLVSATATAPTATVGGSNGQFTITRAGDVTQSMTVYYGISGTAVAGSDYAVLTGSVTFSAGQVTKTIDVVAGTLGKNGRTVTLTVAANPIQTYAVPLAVPVRLTDPLSTNLPAIPQVQTPYVVSNQTNPSASPCGWDSPATLSATATVMIATDPCALTIGPVSTADCHSPTGLLAWFKADSLVLTDGQLVSVWGDSSGNGYAAERAVVAERPVYRDTSIPGGGPIVRFEASNKGLSIGLALGLSVSRSSYTFYLLARYPIGQASFGTLLSAQSSGGGFLVQPSRPGGNFRWFVSGNNPLDVSEMCGWHVWTVAADAVAGNMAIYRDGVIQAGGLYGPGTETDSAWLFGSATGFSTGLIFDLAEVLLYTVAHDAATVAAGAACLRSRWNLS